MPIWDDILTQLRARFSKDRFELWFKSMSCRDPHAHPLVLEVPNRYVRDWVEAHFLDDIVDAVEAALGERRTVVLVAQGAPASPPSRSQDRAQDAGAFGSGASGLGGHPNLFPDDPAGRHAPPAQPGAASSSRPAAPRTRSGGLPTAPAGSAGRSAHPVRSGPAIHGRRSPSALAPGYGFESFVVGPSNQFAHAAAMAVSEHPAENYNPLFIYGGVGLGKTHLMHSIGISLERERGLRVAYLTSEQFMNELIAGIERRKMHAFRDRYRSGCDVLLIDDIHFIAGKERTQEEFFHTFNALYDAGKQVVLTSDKTPQEIPGLEERLASRFSWGLMADIQRPELETRMAILQRKSEAQGVTLQQDVAMYLAESVDANVRELEGALKRLVAHARLSGRELDVALARRIVEPFVRERSSTLSAQGIINTVCNYFGLKVSQMKGRGRARRIAYPRQLAMYLSRQHTAMSYPELGRVFKRDHSTVLSAVRKIERLTESDPTVRGDLDALQRNL